MIAKSFKGDLASVSLPDILEFLRISRKTGILVFKNGNIKKGLHVKDGNIVFANSNLPDERLGDMLLQQGRISREDYERSVSMLGSKKRQGKILVEIGAITPKELWQGVQDQVRQIVFSLYNWERGKFLFSQRELPGKENITADVNIWDLIIEGIRRMKEPQAILSRFTSRDVVLARIDFGIKDKTKLEPFEKHVLDLIDGERTIQEICRDSEIGEIETLKVIYLLLSIGYIKVKGKKPEEGTEPLAGEITSQEVTSVIENYNKMFSYLYRYMMREVGPIAEHVLNKYLLEIRDSNSPVFKNVSLRRDGTLDEGSIAGNLYWIKPERKRELLISSLNEFLYSAILAVKRTLGPEHESHVIETLREIRPVV
jgi:hypothetical protein